MKWTWRSYWWLKMGPYFFHFVVSGRIIWRISLAKKARNIPFSILMKRGKLGRRACFKLVQDAIENCGTGERTFLIEKYCDVCILAIFSNQEFCLARYFWSLHFQIEVEDHLRYVIVSNTICDKNPKNIYFESWNNYFNR